MILQKIFLLNGTHFGHGFQLSEMRPPIFVYDFQFVIATGG